MPGIEDDGAEAWDAPVKNAGAAEPTPGGVTQSDATGTASTGMNDVRREGPLLRDVDPRPRRPQRRMLKMSAVVAREIVHQIVQDGLRLGDMLPSEARMLEEYGVGRGSLREALRILEVFGLISIKPGPGGGPVVADLRPRDFGGIATFYLHISEATFGELLEARRLVESALAGLAARAQEPQRLEALKDSIQRAKTDESSFARSARDFHSHLRNASGNRVLDLFADALTEMLLVRLAGEIDETEIRDGMFHEHEDIVQAIVDGDEARAQEYMRRHLEAVDEYLTTRLPGLVDETIDWN